MGSRLVSEVAWLSVVDVVTLYRSAYTQVGDPSSRSGLLSTQPTRQTREREMLTVASDSPVSSGLGPAAGRPRLGALRGATRSGQEAVRERVAARGGGRLRGRGPRGTCEG